MGLIDLFVKPDENEKKESEQTKESSKFKFPSQNQTTQEPSNNIASFIGFSKTNQTPQVTTTSGAPTQEQIAKALGIYEQGLKSLKQSGYDFQDFYDALTDEDKANPSAYQMALRFASKYDKSITKDSLVQSGDFYISKVVENYNNFVASGNAKKQDVLNQKTNEAQSLNNELGMLQQQLVALQAQITDRQNKINNIDGKYASILSELDAKLAANEIAKNQVVQSLEHVKQGIINNVK
jgi:hypothetical protein